LIESDLSAILKAANNQSDTSMEDLERMAIFARVVEAKSF